MMLGMHLKKIMYSLREDLRRNRKASFTVCMHHRRFLARVQNCTVSRSVVKHKSQFKAYQRDRSDSNLRSDAAPLAVFVIILLERSLKAHGVSLKASIEMC
jgi:hypothetical protein